MMRRTILAILCGLFAAAASEYQAEVRARLTPNGAYWRTEIYVSVTQSSQLLVWSPRRTPAPGRGDVLNPFGDVFGDKFPKIAEDSLGHHHPWVVWSRLDGTDYDLMVSAWQPGGWSAAQWLTDDSSDHGNDLDPDFRFDGQGDPYLVWWREENGTGSVMFSTKVADGWTYPYEISEHDVDSRHPAVLGFPPNGGVLVDYDTPQGRVTRLLMLTRPTSIHEDIDPLLTVTTVP